MNNTDFKRLVQATPRASNNASSEPGFAKPSMSLGSRKVSSIPMTPRTVKGGPSIDFARQLAEQNERPAKKFRSSAAPKGAKLAAGYVDRASKREEEQDARDEREARINALEEQMKLGQIDRQVFEKLRDQITGGDIGATHLIKGLDRQLLERIRKGEDILSGPQNGEEAVVEDEEQMAVDDDALEELAEKEIVPIQREEVKKKGDMAPPPLPAPLAGQKRSRNDILAEWKASREAEAKAKAAAQPQLGSRFRRIDAKTPQPKIERDEKGREVLITVDEHGRVKRKVRRVVQESSTREMESTTSSEGLSKPGNSSTPLGMVVAEQPPPEEDDDDLDDIFDGVGDSYNPLGAAGGDDSASSSDEDEKSKALRPTKTDSNEAATKDSRETESTARPHNYFQTSTETPEEKAIDDGGILEAIKRAAALQPREPLASADADDATSRQSAVAKRLFQRDRDMDDLDMGFGSSRYGDEDEGEGGAKIKLSQWKEAANDQDDGDDGKGEKKPRGGKKKKHKGGDKNSASDILKIIEGRK